MEYQKHNVELAERIRLLNIPADSQLAKELMKLHEAKCTACQEDRLSCTVRPACKNRNFLNMLIELDVEPQDLPSFCYSVYLEQLRRHIIDRKGRGIIDKRLLIKDLLSTLKVSSIRHFNSKFRKVWKNYFSASSKNQMLVAGDGLLFHFDFARGIVIINPTKQRVMNFDVFKLFIEVLSSSKKVNAEAIDITLNWWELKFKLKTTLELEKVSSIKDKLPKSFHSSQIVTTNEAIEIRVEIVVDNSESPIMVSDLVDSFKLASGLKSAA
ncbi:MAG: hypothetical protein KAQ65_03140 [Candidatus Thorarchaeota archaeon]|nr:hypothetical protein [Candidatus Thorarchaeota archaeon]MCK5238341.1 hypothetical protein [Candidatus Thorarchaeota archaeon]